MPKALRDLIEYNGIDKSPFSSDFFKQVNTDFVFCIPDQKPNIEQMDLRCVYNNDANSRYLLDRGGITMYCKTKNCTQNILPEKVGDKYSCDLVRSGRVSVIPYVEGKHTRQLDCRNIHRCIMLFLDVKMC